MNRTKDGKFKAGKSGNSAGRPRGAVGKATILRRQIAEHGDELLTVLIEAAKSGDVQALRLVLERIVPALKPVAETVAFTLDTKAPLADQAAQVMRAVARGAINPDVGSSLISSLAALVKISEYTELEERLTALEGGNSE